MTGPSLSRIFWIGAAAILIVAALIAVTAILRGDFGETEAKILGTLLTLLVAGATAISGLALIERRAAAWISGVAIGGAGVCFAVITAAIWNEFSDDRLSDTAVSAMPVLIALLLLATQRLLLRVAGLAWLFYATAAAASVATGLVFVAVWGEDGGDSEGIGQAIAVFSILTALGYLLLPVLQRFTSAAPVQPTGERVLSELNGVRLVATRSDDGIAPRLEPGERLALRRS